MPTIALVRPSCRLAADVAVCQHYGWKALPLPLLEIIPQPLAIKKLQQMLQTQPLPDAVFWVSPSAVEMGATYFTAIQSSTIAHIAVGEASAKSLMQAGINNIHVCHDGRDSEAVLTLPIWQTLPLRATVWIMRGNGGRELLAETLQMRGLLVSYQEIYCRVPQLADWQAFQAACPQAVWLTSSQLAREYFTQMPAEISQKLQSLLYFTHHPRIAAVLNDLGAKRVYCVDNLASALQKLNASGLPDFNERESIS